jgi:CRISPR-associated endonuclease Cas3-HD
VFQEHDSLTSRNDLRQIRIVLPISSVVEVRPSIEALRVERLVGAEALAHLTDDGRAHPLEDHLEKVGDLAEQFAGAFDSGSVARLAGRWHDLGKYSAAFQRMIREENGFEAHIEVENEIPRDHSTAGAVHAIHQTAIDKDVAAVLAFAIAGHHAGLADSDQLKRRLQERAGFSFMRSRAVHPRTSQTGLLPSQHGFQPQ